MLRHLELINFEKQKKKKSQNVFSEQKTIRGLIGETIWKHILVPQIKTMEAGRRKNSQVKFHLFQFCADVIF